MDIFYPKSCSIRDTQRKKIPHKNRQKPADVLLEDFMKPFGLSAYAVAKAIGTNAIAISQICRRKRSVSAEMALKLGRLFNVSPELWMGIQADYDLEVARFKKFQSIPANSAKFHEIPPRFIKNLP